MRRRLVLAGLAGLGGCSVLPQTPYVQRRDWPLDVRRPTTAVAPKQGRVLLVRAILAERRFVNQIRLERVNVGNGRANRGDEVAVRELSPTIAGRAQDGAEAGLRLIILHQADIHRVM